MNLLADPVFTTLPLGPLSLPSLLAASVRGEVGAFSRLRAHQRASWHMFRVQLAALALDRGGVAEPPTDEAAWADLLLRLTDGDVAPWSLIVPDRTTPAFLQPPDPGGLNWEPVATPDALDMLITARNHDLKGAVARDADPEDWAYALVSLQTGEGYGGRGNFGVARMNGGSSSRAMLGLAPAGGDGQPDPSSWWLRDLRLLLRRRNEPTPLIRGGPALLWCLPWPEGRQIPAQDMDPWAVEICRRVRLHDAGGVIGAERAGSAASRVQAKAFAGVLGDPWAPIDKRDKTPKALTLGEGRFDYRRMITLLTSAEWDLPLAARLDVEDGAPGDMVVVAEALSRGNSKTDGLKSRTIPLPARIRRARDLPERLSTASLAQMGAIKNADAALRDAVALYAARGDATKVGKPQRQRAATARHRLDDHADRVFFPRLWERIAAMEIGPDAVGEADRAFRHDLVRVARVELDRAYEALPCPSILAPRARTRARGKLEGLLRHHRLILEEENV